MPRQPTSRELELWTSYEKAVFRLRTGAREVRFGVGNVSPEIDELLEARGVKTWAHITAWNPGSNPTPEGENRRRQQGLLAALQRPGWFVLDGDGSDPSGEWPPEPTVFVGGIAEREAQRIGHAYGQLAIVVGRRGEPSRLVACDPELVVGVVRGL